MNRVKTGRLSNSRKRILSRRELIIGSFLAILTMQGAGSNFLSAQTPAVPESDGTVNITAEKNSFSSDAVYPGELDTYNTLTFQQPEGKLIPFTNYGQIGSGSEGLVTLNASEIGLFTNDGTNDNVGAIYWTESLLFSALTNQNGTIVGTDGTITVGTDDNPGNVLNSGVTAVIGGSGMFEITGSLTNVDQGVIRNIDSLTVGGDLTQSGTLNNNTKISVTGILSNTAGTISNGASLIAGSINNTSVISDVADISTNGALRNSGTITNTITDTDTVVSGNLLASTSLTNSGEISNLAAITTTETLANSGTISNITKLTASSVDNNGTLDHIAAIAGNVQNNTGGTISLATGSADTVMEITRDLTNSGTLEIDIDSRSGATDQFLVSGIADINGGTLIVTDLAGGSGQYKANDTYKFLLSSDLTVAPQMTVDTDNSELPNLSKLLVARCESDGQNYYLKIARAREYAPGATTYNQEQFGEYLDDLGENFVQGSDLENVLEQLDLLSPDEDGGITPEARLAMAEMDGAVYGSLAAMTVQHQTIVNNKLTDLIRPTSDPCATVSSGGASYGSAICSSPCVPARNLWGEYYRVDGSAEYDGNAFGGDNKINGVICGADKYVTPDLLFGGFFAYGDSTFSVNGLDDRAKTDAWKFGLYFVKNQRAGYLLGNVNYGYDEYDVTRHINFLDRTHNGRTDGDQWSARIEKGFNYAVGRTMFQPFGAFQFITLDTDGFQETGAGSTALRVDESTYESYRSEFGGRAVWNRTYSDDQFGSLIFKATWLHEFGDTCGTVVGQFSNPRSENYTGTVNPYSISGVDLGEDWCNLGVGGDFSVGNMTLFAGYDFLFNGEQNLNTGNVGLAYQF